MSIQKEFVLRHRAEGHVRFQVPVEVCTATLAGQITEGIQAIPGVYRVKLYRSQQKLSIRYQESVCDFPALARQLYKLLGELEANLQATPKVSPNPAWRQQLTNRLRSFKAARWAEQKYTDAKETVQAAKIITNLGLKTPKALIKDPEKAITDFLNDVLVLFMIRLHWDDITKLWLVKPFKYRYEWMAVFYMVFLLVRSRKPK